jgi:hypothetical protein
MEPILKSDVFFFITSVFVVILTALLVIAGYYLIKILKNLSETSKTVKDVVQETGNDFREIRQRVKQLNPMDLIFRRKKRTKKESTKSV